MVHQVSDSSVEAQQDGGTWIESAPEETSIFQSRVGFWLMHILLLASLLGAWDLAVRFEVVHTIVLPAPIDVATAFGRLITADFLPGHVWATASEALAGFAIAGVGGFLAGALLTFYSPLRRLFYPYIVVFYNLPKVALAPLFIGWLGFGQSSKIVMAATIAFFPVLINTMVGLQTVTEDSILLMRSLVAKKWQVFRSLALPSALPAIFAGLKTAMTLALIGAIVAEFVGAKQGLAVLIGTFNFQFKIDSMYAVLVILGATGLLLFALIDFAERKIVFWHDDPHRL
jgi:NitT/TauT family transport system permease protein